MRRFRLYDTLSRQTRLFVPITPPKVGLFVCGITPYAPPHVGHGKLAVFFDVVARALTHWGYRVFYVQNVTNLDDKILDRAGAEGVDPFELAGKHYRTWQHAMDELDVRSVNYYPFATDYVPEILEQIRALIDKGHAYASAGSVYYDVSSFPPYGKLSGQRTEALKPGARVAVDAAKRAPEDFVLWKASRPGEPSWESPWGPGRPGWHIEDTAITVRLHGPRYDIHGAAVDLLFPHHEAEIAQAEGATGQSPLVNFWMHIGLLTMTGEKMSKSIGNVFDLEEAIRAHSPEVLRFFYLNANYRSPLEFNVESSLAEAREAYERLAGPARRLLSASRARASDDSGSDLPAVLSDGASSEVHQMDELLADDFNTREAIARLFGWTKTVSPWLPKLDSLSGSAVGALAAPYAWAAEVLGLFFEPEDRGPSTEAFHALIEPVLAARRRARERGDFAEADRIRDELATAGIQLEDHGNETRWQLSRRPNP